MLLAVGWAADVVAAQEALAATPEIEAAVRTLVASEWGVEPEAIELEWGSYAEESPVSGTEVELVGTGAGGYWIARLGVPPDHVVAVRVRAGHRVRRLVAARRLARGNVISNADIATEEALEWGAPSGVEQQVREGWITQRVLAKGDPLTTPGVRAPWIVTTGRPVEVLWLTGVVGLRVPGRAVGSGALGDHVYVRTESGKRMKGVIVAPGVVDVTHAAARSARGGEE